VSAPESEEDLHDGVEAADVPRLLRDPEEAGEDAAARGGARLRDYRLHHPLAHLAKEGKLK
jgi:hypothetical protein